LACSSALALRPDGANVLTRHARRYLGDFEREDLLDLVLLRAMAEDEAQLKEMLKEIGVAKMGHREVIAKALRQQ